MKASKRALERAARGLPEPARCGAKKRDGTPCRRWPLAGATRCRLHGAAAPQVKEKARMRLLEASDQLMAALLKIAMSAESEGVRLAAIKDALDRAGFGAAQLHKLTVTDPWADLLESVMDEEVLERVTDAKPRGLPPGRGGGVEFDDDDEDYDYDATAARDPDDEDPEPRRPVVIRGEVVHDRPTPTPVDTESLRRTAERARQRIVSNVEPGDDEIDRSEFGDVASVQGAADDATMPPAYVRQAMEDEGKDWRTGQPLKVQWTG